MATMYSTNEAADSLGISSSRVRQLLISSHLTDDDPIGGTFSGMWVLNDRDIDRLRKRKDMRFRENRKKCPDLC
jgi:hypothetical protein